MGAVVRLLGGDMIGPRDISLSPQELYVTCSFLAGVQADLFDRSTYPTTGDIPLDHKQLQPCLWRLLKAS
jgi:hypothetical protein